MNRGDTPAKGSAREPDSIEPQEVPEVWRALYEPVDVAQVPAVWPLLTNEAVMFPMRMENVAMRIGPEHQLFLDNCLIAETSNLRREVHEPARFEGNPILRPCEGGASQVEPMHVFQFEESPRFRMWYWSYFGDHAWREDEEIRFATSYAVSEDGEHWTRPDLDLCQIDAINERNITLPYGLMHGLFYEPWEDDPQKRFKALVCVQTKPRARDRAPAIPKGYYLHTSPDGIHWQADFSRCVVPALNSYAFPQDGAGDTTRFWWDSLRKKYIGDIKWVILGKIRCQGMMESDDLIHWTRPHSCPPEKTHPAN